MKRLTLFTTAALVALHIPGMTVALDETDFFAEFLTYTEKVYLQPLRSELGLADAQLWLLEPRHRAQLLGYALGNLLKFTMPPGSDNHKAWLVLERRSEAWLADWIASYGRQQGWDAARLETEQRENRLRWMAALQGWGDETLAAVTSVRPEAAPDFFAQWRAKQAAARAPHADPPPPIREVDRGSDSGGRGSTQWLTADNDPEFAGLIARGMGARNRPSGSATAGTEAPDTRRRVVIKNNTPHELHIYFDSQAGQRFRKLGTVAPQSQETFFDHLANRTGRWYLTVVPGVIGAGYKEVHRLIYLREDQFEYVFEFVEYHFRGDSAADQSVRSVLTRGWDGFNEPLSSGDVTWRVHDGDTLEVGFSVRGARPNHTYTVGSHLFGSKPFRVGSFLGYSLGTSDATSISREGKSAYVVAYDLGKLTTDSLGNGAAWFSGRVPAGSYPLQFTVRIGECLPIKGITSGCAAVFRTGGQFAGRLENIRIGQSVSGDSASDH